MVSHSSWHILLCEMHLRSLLGCQFGKVDGPWKISQLGGEKFCRFDDRVADCSFRVVSIERLSPDLALVLLAIDIPLPIVLSIPNLLIRSVLGERTVALVARKMPIGSMQF